MAKNIAINRGFVRSNPKEISYLHIDIGDDYYSTSDQILKITNPTFRDRSEATSASVSSGSIGFFSSIATPKSGSSRQNSEWVPSWQQSDQYLTGSIDPKVEVAYNVDYFRNGVELRNVNQWAAGYVKISSGTPGHIISEPVAIGSLRNNNNIDKDWYKELDYFDPKSLLQDTPIYSLSITYPIVLTDAEETDKNGYNGTIEALTIRDIVKMTSITGIQEPRSIKGSFGNGNQRSPWEGSEDIVSVVEFSVLNELFPFIDQFEFETGYIGVDAKHLGPCKDLTPARDHEDESKYESDLLAVVRQMPLLETTYIREKELTHLCGFVYDNSGTIGTDSVTFGGLLY